LGSCHTPDTEILYITIFTVVGWLGDCCVQAAGGACDDNDDDDYDDDDYDDVVRVIPGKCAPR
jgi:hypothetical protein